MVDKDQNIDGFEQSEQTLEGSKRQLELLNESISQMLRISELQVIYQYIVSFLNRLYPNTITLLVSINEPNKDTVLEVIEGIGDFLEKVISISGYNPIGRHYSLHGQHNDIFKSGKLVHFKGGLAEFSASEYPTTAAKALQRLTGIRNIYTIGINKDDEMIAAIHIFTRTEIKIEDHNFVEAFVGQAGLILHKKIVEQSLIEGEEKLRELNATKDKFFRIISHDLKSPFGAIIGMSEHALKEAKNKNFDKLESYLELIRNSSRRSFDLLNNLLEWSQIQMGAIEFRPQTLQIEALVNKSIDLLETNCREKKIKLSKSIENGLTAIGDSYMYDAIIRNLLSNAIKYTHDNGNIELKAFSKNGNAILSVKDDGVGIDEEDIEKLFHIESDFSSPGTRDEQGTGLGLILCKEFVTKQGGRIWLTSKKNEGTEFFVELKLG